MVESPTKSWSLTRTLNGSHKFVIQGYSLAKGLGVGRHLASDNFSVGGYEWAIYFYPDGKNPEDNPAHVSVFIALASEGTDVRALFELTLVDQSGKGKHKVHSHFERSLESGPYTLKYRGSMWGYKRFFKRTALETSDYLKDDCLKFTCTVGVVVSATECLRTRSIQVPESDIGAQFGALLESEEGTDLTIKVGDETFHAHKLILAARSPLLRSRLFSEVSDESRVLIIEDMDPKVFKGMLHYIYWDTLIADAKEDASDSSHLSTLLNSFTVKLLTAADDYGLDRLKIICGARLCKDISIPSICGILTLADHCHAAKLKSVCLRYAVENLTAVMQTEGFKHLKENSPSLQSELLKTVAGFEDDSISGGGKTRSVWAQVSDGSDSNGRRVRQRSNL